MEVKKENKICLYAWKGLQLSPNGEVSMCCFQHGKERIDINSTDFKFFKNQMLINEKATSKDKQDFKNFIIKKDKTRKTSIFDSCPEFKDIWDDIK